MTETAKIIFPLVRKLSSPLTPWFLRTSITANQMTTASLLLGASSGALFAAGVASLEVLGALAFVLCYVLDNCDGEIARKKQQATEFGAFYDTLVDWLVHTAFFVGLGVGTSHATGNDLWFWLGLAAGAGGTINYLLGFCLDAHDDVHDSSSLNAPRPNGAAQWLLFAFRELARADFCFIVLALAPFGLTWLLLPAGAIGAQVYWMAQFYGVARRFHV